MSPTVKLCVVLFLPCVLLLLGLEALLRPDPTLRNYEVLTEMVYSKAAESLSPSSVLPGLETQQPVPAGVVVRGLMPFHYGAGPEEAQRAGRELRNPVAGTPADLERGAVVYQRYCAVCHAGDGGGQGPVVQRGMLPPPSLLGARAMSIEDGELFHILTLGQGNMASYAAQVTVDDRWKVICHVRAMQEAAR